MPFSVLLLTAANSERHITGASKDKVRVGSLQPGELVLCFDKLDTTDIVRLGLGIPRNQKCCDGVIYYANGILKVICLVEMKHSRLDSAAEQIKRTYEHLYQRLKSECKGCEDVFKQIVWRAYVYRIGSSAVNTEECKKILSADFGPGNVLVSSNPDILRFLRGENETVRRKGFQKGKR